MSKKLTRRQWSVVLAAAAAPAGTAQTPTNVTEQVRQNLARNRETLAQFKIPMSLEPAFRFEA